MTESTANLLSVSCNHCGAPLQVPPGTRFVTCSYCSSRLEVHQSHGAVYTQVLKSIGRIAEDVDAIRWQNDLEQLDREWMMRRESLLQRGKDGRTSVPSTAGSIIGAIVAVAFGILWIGVVASANGPGFIVFFGVLIIGIGLVGGILGATKASEYETAEREYQQRRAALLSRRPPNQP